MNNKDIINFGFVQPIEFGILQILKLLSKDIYGNIPLKMIDNIIEPIQLGHYYCSTQNQRCIGVILYVKITTETANICIKEKREPTIGEKNINGSEIFMIAISGKPLLKLIRNFFRLHRGKLILYNRHFIENGKKVTEFGYVDRDGKRSC